jgi:hypothetical protein
MTASMNPIVPMRRILSTIRAGGVAHTLFRGCIFIMLDSVLKVDDIENTVTTTGFLIR